MYVLLFYLALSLFIQIALFIPAYTKGTDKLTDLSYSLTFILLALLVFPLSCGGAVKITAAFMIIIWGLRLGTFLVIRINRSGKDRRFDGIREVFGRFLRFWLLQGVTVWLLMLPFFVLLMQKRMPVLTPASAAGLCIWLTGLIIESAADWQKFAFRFNPANKGRWIDQGLWQYSRHPNYFGEMLCWWGVYLFIFPHITSFQRAVTVVSPLFITLMLLFLTGIPPLEKKAMERWGDDPDYLEYKRKTSALIPFFRKK